MSAIKKQKQCSVDADQIPIWETLLVFWKELLDYYVDVNPHSLLDSREKSYYVGY